MARKRSPNYPAISLPDAIERIQKIHEIEHQNPASREVMAVHLGYGGLNGASLKVLSALMKFGLLEKVEDGEVRVSDRAIDILFPEGGQRQQAIEAAALSPVLFQELREKWSDRLPSDENLRSHLIRRQFAQSAIADVIRTFRDTFSLVTRESGEYDSADRNRTDEKERPPMQQDIEQGKQQRSLPPPPIDQPLRVSITSEGLEVSARLSNARAVEKLIQILNANKPLLGTPPEDVDISDDDNYA